MRNIRMEKDIILYYGNPAGYVSGGKAVVDPLFESEELNAFLSRQKDIGEVKWSDGVYDRLVNGQRDAQELTLLKSCRVWQLKPESDIRMRFISLLDFCKSFGEPKMSNYQTVYDGEVETNDLEALYTKFNTAHPPGYAGHSLSMSDVLELYDENGSSFYYPILSDLYTLIEEEYKGYDESSRQLYTAELLQNILLGLHSICKGAESKFFDGHTNITDSSFVTFGLKGMMQASKSLKNALLFNLLSYMSNELLTNGNTAASIDELYLFLTNMVAIEYIRNFSKRVRKKDSLAILASQNLEDFNIEGIREYTKPLFSIPTHQFLFNAGNIDAKFYIDTLQLEQSEYNLIR